MSAIEIVVLIGTIVKELGAMILQLIAAGGTKKTPEEVRQDIKDLVDGCDDNWLEAEVKKTDAKFNTPG
jgi:hypothetical protein